MLRRLPLLFLTAALLSACGGSDSDRPSSAAGSPPADTAAPPRFEEFAATDTFSGTPAKPDLSDPDAAAFRTAITEGVKKGPNFAGRFTVVEWGCGTECQEFVVVDARTGRVYLDTPTLALGAAYRRDSRLLVVNPPENLAGLAPDVRARTPTLYYVWEDSVLLPLP